MPGRTGLVTFPERFPCLRENRLQTLFFGGVGGWVGGYRELEVLVVCSFYSDAKAQSDQ